MKKNLKKITAFLLVIVCTTLYACVDNGDGAKAEITLNSYTLQLEIGESFQLQAQTSIADSTVIWSSETKEIATVDIKGLVTGVSEGSVKIFASIGDAKTQCIVTVTEPLRAVPELLLDYKTLNVYMGYEFIISPYLRVGNDFTEIEGESINWQSSDKDVAQVVAGKIIPVSEGATTISASYTYDGKTLNAECTITVGVLDESVEIIQARKDITVPGAEQFILSGASLFLVSAVSGYFDLSFEVKDGELGNVIQTEDNSFTVESEKFYHVYTYVEGEEGEEYNFYSVVKAADCKIVTFNDFSGADINNYSITGAEKEIYSDANGNRSLKLTAARAMDWVSVSLPLGFVNTSGAMYDIVFDLTIEGKLASYNKWMVIIYPNAASTSGEYYTLRSAEAHGEIGEMVSVTQTVNIGNRQLTGEGKLNFAMYHSLDTFEGSRVYKIDNIRWVPQMPSLYINSSNIVTDAGEFVVNEQNLGITSNHSNYYSYTYSVINGITNQAIALNGDDAFTISENEFYKIYIDAAGKKGEQKKLYANIITEGLNLYTFDDITTLTGTWVVPSDNRYMPNTITFDDYGNKRFTMYPKAGINTAVNFPLLNVGEDLKVGDAISVYFDIVINFEELESDGWVLHIETSNNESEVVNAPQLGNHTAMQSDASKGISFRVQLDTTLSFDTGTDNFRLDKFRFVTAARGVNYEIYIDNIIVTAK